ncbi:MAG TPA: hypothetical protein VGG33_13540 [Polyangia bacterium]
MALALSAFGLTACGPDSFVDREETPDIGGVLRADAGPGRGGSAKPDAGPAVTSDAGASSNRGDAASGTRPDTTAATCQELPLWKSDTAYGPEDRVRHGNPARSYKCRPWPQGLWCSKTTYEPADEPGAWVDAWIDEGACP